MKGRREGEGMEVNKGRELKEGLWKGEERNYKKGYGGYRG